METTKASDVITRYSKGYCEEVIKNLFPSPIDGLITSKRRIIQTQDANKQIPSTELIGNTFKIHNHNTESIYNTATSMCDQFKCSIPLLELIGSGNNYFNQKAAAARYTEFRISDLCKDLFFRGVNRKTLPTKLSSDLTGRELVHFIPKVPTALLIPCNTIGYGFSSKTIPIGITETCDLVMFYLKKKQLLGDCDFTSMAKKFLPKLPILCSLVNRAELIHEYKQGNFAAPVVTEGFYKILSDKVVLIRTLAYNESADTAYNGFITAMRDKNHWVSKEELRIFTTSTDNDYCDFEISMHKMNRNIFAAIDKLKSLLKIHRTTYPHPNYVIGDNMARIDPPQIIQMWYQARFKSIMNSKRYRQKTLYHKITELEVYVLVCRKKDEVTNIMKSVTSVEDGQAKFSKAFDLTLRQCEILANTNLRTLSAYKEEELKKQIADHKHEMKQLVESFNRIDEEIAEDTEKFKKRYHNDPNYSSFQYKWKGCLYVDGMGIALFCDQTELLALAGHFKNKRKSVFLFDGATHISFRRGVKILASTSVAGELSPSYHADHIGLEFKGKTCIAFNGHRWSNKWDPNVQIMYVSGTPYTVSLKGGIIKQDSLKFMGDRKRTATHRFAFDVDPSVKEFIVISINSASWNEITLQRTTLGKRLVTNPAGHEYIMAVVPVGTTDISFNCPMHPKINFVTIPKLHIFAKKKLNHLTFRRTSVKF